MTEQAQELPAAELAAAVAALKQNGPQVLAAIYDGPSVLVGVDAGTGQLRITMRATAAAEAFALLLAAAQHIGRGLGLDLQWMKDNRKAPDLIVPRGAFK